MVTSAGTGGVHRAWGIPVASHTLNIAIGGVGTERYQINDQTVSSEHLCLTVSFDHNIIDGAPASRFVRSFVKIIESEIFSENLS